MSRHWVVVGCGGHGREVADILIFLGENILGFLDDDPTLIGSAVGGIPVLGGLEWLKHTQAPISIGLGIGAGLIRKQIVQHIKSLDRDIDFPPIIHPRATLGSRINIGEGTLIQAGCILTCDITVGAFAVLNLSVTLSHDVMVGDYATIAPGTHLTGGVICGTETELGAGTLAIPRCSIGSGAITGAGAVVIHSITPGDKVVGVPASSLNNTHKLIQQNK